MMSITTFENLHPKAKKDHQCDYCLGTIKKGEVYDYQKNMMDGEFYVWRSHKACTFIGNNFYGDTSYEGIPSFCEWEPEYLKGCALFMFNHMMEVAEN